MFSDFSRRPPAANMAMDEALLRTLSEPVLRFYDWDRPCVSLGYFQPLSEIEGRFPDRALVRRWTGGGAVVHGRDLTFSVIVPRGHALAQQRPADSYVSIHRAVIAALQLPGATLVCEIATTPGGCCFEKPVPGDIVLKGRKICGGAQRRSRHGLLHQGSISRNPGDPGFFQRLAECLGWNARPEPIPPQVEELARELAVTRYGRPEWLRGRSSKPTR